MRFLENCPQCGSSNLNQDNPFGKIECQNCSWLGDASEFSKKSHKSWSKSAQRCLFGLFLGFTLFFGVQLVLWQKFSIEASWLILKRAIGQATLEDWLSMGAICNSLEKFDCSVDAFSEVVQRQPRQRTALANLAIAHCHLGSWNESRKYFEAYFSLGGEAYDTMFWYARSLIRLGEKERGIEWYYKTLTKKPDYLEALTELVDQLVSMGRAEEALSLVGHHEDGHPEKDVFWGQKVMSINSFLQSQENRNDRSSIAEFLAPSLNGDQYYLPLWMAEKGLVKFMLVDESQPDLILPRSTIDAQLIREVLTKRKLRDFSEVDRLEIPRLKIGPWWMSNVTVSLCDECELRVGRQMLDYLKMKEWVKFGVEFLSFSNDESDSKGK